MRIAIQPTIHVSRAKALSRASNIMSICPLLLFSILETETAAAHMVFCETLSSRVKPPCLQLGPSKGIIGGESSFQENKMLFHREWRRLFLWNPEDPMLRCLRRFYCGTATPCLHMQVTQSCISWRRDSARRMK